MTTLKKTLCMVRALSFKTRKAAKLREFKVFSHCTPTVLHVVAEISHGKDSVFFQLIPKELEFDP